MAFVGIPNSDYLDDPDMGFKLLRPWQQRGGGTVLGPGGGAFPAAGGGATATAGSLGVGFTPQIRRPVDWMMSLGRPTGGAEAGSGQVGVGSQGAMTLTNQVGQGASQGTAGQGSGQSSGWNQSDLPGLIQGGPPPDMALTSQGRYLYRNMTPERRQAAWTEYMNRVHGQMNQQSSTSGWESFANDPRSDWAGALNRILGQSGLAGYFSPEGSSAITDAARRSAVNTIGAQQAGRANIADVYGMDPAERASLMAEGSLRGQGDVARLVADADTQQRLAAQDFARQLLSGFFGSNYQMQQQRLQSRLTPRPGSQWGALLGNLGGGLLGGLLP